MNILHITEHMGDGAGKAIGGLAVLGSKSGEDTHRILLLGEPRKLNHIGRCRASGIEVLAKNSAEPAISGADVVVLSWWGGPVMNEFLRKFPAIPCRVILWTHKNGFYDPPLPHELVKACDYLLATSPFTFENPDWRDDSTLVYGFGDFNPEGIPPKTDYALNSDSFVIGYVGMPSYKRLPRNTLDYMRYTLSLVPNAVFILAGECSDEFKADVISAGLADKVKLTGWTDNVFGLLSTFDVFGYLLRPNTSATTENSVLEAMAAALPVVVSKYPIGKYLLEDTISGFLAETPEEYGQNILKLYSDEALRQRIGKSAREHTVRNYRANDNLRYFNEACRAAAGKPKNIHQFE